MSERRQSEPDRMINRGFSWGFWGTLITLMILVGGIELYGALSLHRQITEAIESPHAGDARDDLKGAASTNKALETSSWRTRLINETFNSASGEYSALSGELRAHIKAKLKVSRQRVDAKVNDWADWYFSVIGEYARLGHLGAQAVGKSNLDEFMVEQLSKRVFKPAGVFEDLAALNKEVEQRFTQRHKEVISHLKRVMKNHAESNKGEISDQERALIEDKLSRLDRLTHVATISPLALAAKLGSIGGVKAGLKVLISRSAMKAATAGGAKVAAAGGAKVAAASGAKVAAASGAKVAAASGAKAAAVSGAKVAAMSGAKVAAKGAVKVGAKAGAEVGALATGASAAALCAPLGPVAALCGITAGVVTWFAVDKAIVEIDELINREEFVAESRREFIALMDTLENETLSDLDRYQSQILKLMVSEQVEQLDKPPQSTRLVDQLQVSPESSH